MDRFKLMQAWVYQVIRDNPEIVRNADTAGEIFSALTEHYKLECGIVVLDIMDKVGAKPTTTGEDE